MLATNDLFVDTAGWVFYLDRRHSKYEASVALVQDTVAQSRRLVTTNYIVAELVPLLTSRHRLRRQEVISAINTIKDHPSIEIVHIDQSLDEEAWELLEKYSDKEWSLADACSFLIMKRFNMTRVLTADHHFDQVGFGFIRLPSL